MLATRMGGTILARLNDQQIEEGLAGLSGWAREGDAIVRESDHDDFTGAVGFVDRLVGPANEMNHHPDVAISWSTVKVTLSTHSEGGLTEADFELAHKIDALGN